MLLWLPERENFSVKFKLFTCRCFIKRLSWPLTTAERLDVAPPLQEGHLRHPFRCFWRFFLNESGRYDVFGVSGPRSSAFAHTQH